MAKLTKRDIETATSAAWVLVAFPFFVGFGIVSAMLNSSDTILFAASCSLAGFSVLGSLYFFPRVWKVNARIKSNGSSLESGPIKKNLVVEGKRVHLAKTVGVSFVIGLICSGLVFVAIIEEGMAWSFGGGAILLAASAILEALVKSVLSSWSVTT